MGLATVIALMALFIAFVALWLVSDVLKKVESQNEKFLRAHIKTLRDEMRELDGALTKLTRAVKSVEDVAGRADTRVNDHAGKIDEVFARTAALAEKLDQLDQSIPPRYRTRIVKSQGDDGKQTSTTVQ